MKRLADKPFVLLGVNSDPDRQQLMKTLLEENITWNSWWDQGSINGPIHTTWQIVQRPTIHLIDAQGVIRHREVQPSKLDQAIEELLAETEGEPGKDGPGETE